MFYPFNNPDLTMIATAVWQPSPIFVNIIWAILSTIVGETPATNSASGSKTTVKRYFFLAYIGAGLIGAISHISTLYACLSPAYPDITFRSIFLPVERMALPFDEAVHFIFQIDYLIIFISTTVWCLQVSSEAQGTGNRSGGVMGRVLKLIAGVAAIGPAATLSAVWHMRENRLVKQDLAKKKAI
jgi:hypothetical protein